MKILIAPDKFKDALDAATVARALAAGARAARPDAQIVLCPLADGGEGTGRLLAAARGAQERRATVLDPLGRPRAARWWLDAANPVRKIAILEMAEASGLALLQPGERDALRTSSYGTGQLIRAARAAGCRKIILCVGGSATVDGGAGCLQALGYALIQADGKRLKKPAGSGQLETLAALRPPAIPFNIELEILCDVDNPMTGRRGAARVFGPQKFGPHLQAEIPWRVRALETGLRHWANVLARFCGRPVHRRKSGGAAGGVPAALMAACGARVRRGLPEIALQVGLLEKMETCNLCLTGEGRIDEQTARGKVVAGVARLARKRNVPVVAFVGAARPGPGRVALTALAKTLGLRAIVVVTPPGTPLRAALAKTAANLRAAAQRYISNNL